MVSLTKVRFLTYEKRVRADLDALFAEDPDVANRVFNKEYIQTLRGYVDQTEGWEIKLSLFSFGVLFLLIVGAISSDNSISIFGASFKNATGLKEALMVLLTSAGLATTGIGYAKAIRLTVLKYLREKSTDPRFEGFAALADRTPFHGNLYVTKAYSRWIFGAGLTRLYHAVLMGLIAVCYLAVLVGVLAITIYFVVDIYEHPTLPAPWSTIVAAYVIAGSVLSILAAFAGTLPLPFKDKSAYLELKRLEETDKQAYLRRLDELTRGANKR